MPTSWMWTYALIFDSTTPLAVCFHFCLHSCVRVDHPIMCKDGSLQKWTFSRSKLRTNFSVDGYVSSDGTCSIKKPLLWTTVCCLFDPLKPALQIPCCDTEILFTMLIPLWVCVVKHGCNSEPFRLKKNSDRFTPEDKKLISKRILTQCCFRKNWFLKMFLCLKKLWINSMMRKMNWVATCRFNCLVVATSKEHTPIVSSFLVFESSHASSHDALMPSSGLRCAKWTCCHKHLNEEWVGVRLQNAEEYSCY